VRPDNLDALPFADTADQDPDALPFGTPDEDGTSGQDRESYTDDQDRDSYTVTP
jgi:hypothetical protein